MIALKTYNRPLNTFSFVDDIFNNLNYMTHKENAAPANLVEKDEAYILTMEIPGYKKDELDIDYHQGVLKVAGNRMDQWDNDSHHFHLKEIGNNYFVRHFKLQKVDHNKIEASYDHGVLNIYIPKIAKPEGKKITIGQGKLLLNKIKPKVKSVS